MTLTAELPRAEQTLPLALANLHLEPDDLVRHLAGSLERGDALDAFLLAAGLHQITEDALERDRLRLADAQRLLPARARRGVATVSRGVAAMAGPRGNTAQLGRLVDRLADCVIAGADLPQGVADVFPSALAEQAGVLRLPACFRGFDQHPEDMLRLAASFARQWPDRARPVAVVGVRTSGSYLAPLTASALRADGYSEAVALTMRPSHPIDRRKRRLLREVIRGGGLLIVTDDPPASGDSIARVAQALRWLGSERGTVVPMFAMHAGDSVPAALADYTCVTLSWEDWSIHERLAPESVARSLERLWPGTSVGEVTRLPIADADGRGHVSARYRVEVEGGLRDVFARGAGLGYLGTHAMAVAERLDGWLPRIHGVVDGLTFRAWLPDEARAAPTERDVAEYAGARRRQLAVERDPSEQLGGHDPVWEAASNLLSGAFARGWRPMRIAALDRLTRELLRADSPCVIDGYMHPSAWFEGPLKAKAAERAFSNRNLACCDAAYDVAAAAALADLDASELRREFARVSGEWIDGERFLVYQLVAAWAARRDGVFDAQGDERASARALRRYLAEIFLDDVPDAGGELCALDVDGVLETETLGFPGPSPASALALRALRAHGYRPLLASGRSVGEIADRCRDYGLIGGVAEYGAAICASGELRGLVSSDGAAAVERARSVLREMPAVELGSEHVHTIRAWRRSADGRRGPLLDEDVSSALEAGALRAVPGESQTDIVPDEVDKARGLRALAERLGSGEARLALAVGDAVEDIPMLRAASLGVAPANADAAVRSSGVARTRRPYQAGLSEAVAGLIGHRPGGCSVCAPPPHERRTELMLGILAARERGPAGLAAQALRTTWRARAAR